MEVYSWENLQTVQTNEAPKVRHLLQSHMDRLEAA